MSNLRKITFVIIAKTSSEILMINIGIYKYIDKANNCPPEDAVTHILSQFPGQNINSRRFADLLSYDL